MLAGHIARIASQIEHSFVSTVAVLHTFLPKFIQILLYSSEGLHAWVAKVFIYYARTT